MDKKWYLSKTLWVNTVAGVAVILQAITGKQIMNPEGQAAIIVIVNMLLRVITKTGLTA